MILQLIWCSRNIEDIVIIIIIIMETVIHFFLEFFDKESSKEQLFCNIINQCHFYGAIFNNASKNVFKKSYWPQMFEQ